MRTKPSACPECGTVLDAATGITKPVDGPPKMDKRHRPKQGDFSMCAVCTQVIRYTKGGKLEAVSDTEFRELPLDIRELFHTMRRVFHKIAEEKEHGDI